LLIVLLFWDRAALASAEKRVALVVGNGRYEHAPVLINPRNDASDMAAALRSIGFEVFQGFDLTKAAMDEKVREFARASTDANIVLFFYAGHGMQVDGVNYLLPTDAQLLDSSSLDFETIELDRVTRNMQGSTKTSLIFLDSCRNNPLTRNFVQAVGSTRALNIERGLAPTTMSGDGLFIAYATAPNDVALDGTGRNSPFTTALLEHLVTPSVEIQQVMTRVKADVHRVTNGKQRPWHNSDLRNEVFLAGRGEEERSAVSLNRSAEDELWSIVQTSKSSELAAIFLERFPKSGHSKKARRLIEAAAQKEIETALLKPDEAIPERLDSLDFEKAKNISTLRGWDLYLAKHGQSPLAEQARQMRAQIAGPADVSPSGAERSMSLTPDQRRRVQGALIDQGYNPGQPDGSFGSRTRREIEAYQRNAGLVPTGYIDRATAERLRILDPTTETFVSSDKARIYKVEDLKGLESDERILRAVECFKDRPIIYGRMRGRVYVIVLQNSVTVSAAQVAAQRCSAYLASIGSKEENDFIYNMALPDQRLFYAIRDGSESRKTGLWIGLQQDRDSPEPMGGWRWSNGDAFTYDNWASGNPDNYGGSQNYAYFWANGPKMADPARLDPRRWDDVESMAVTNSFVVEFE